MKKRSFFMAWLFLSVFTMHCCSDSNKSGTKPYNPGEPVAITSFMPDSGRIAEKILIKGSNFGNDVSIVHVRFCDSTGKQTAASVVGIDNENIYCIVPRQLGGNNEITVEVGDQSVTAEKTFLYKVSENVSTISGDPDKKSTKDGTLAEANFQDMWGVACLGNDEAIVGQAWSGGGVRFVSVDDDDVITIHSGPVIGKLSANKAKTKVYGMIVNASHTIYVYEKNNAWAPTRVGDVRSDIIPSSADVWSCALDGTEEWLYYVGNNGVLAKVELANPSHQEIVVNSYEQLGSGTFNYIAYSAYEDCFYITQNARNKIYRMTPEGALTEVNEIVNTGTVDGYLSEARFNDMLGLTVDESGNIYIVQRNQHVIRKITLNTGYVSTVAGINGTAGTDDGDPAEATLKYPSDICYDGDGGFWIVSCWNPVIRKYAVE